MGDRFKSVALSDFFINYSPILYDIICCTDARDYEELNGFLPWPYVKKSECLVEKDYDIVVITSSKFYNEIKTEIINAYAIPESKIISLNSCLLELYNRVFKIELFDNKVGVEIGGPSSIFTPIYNVCKACDGVNFSPSTTWWKKSGEKYLAGEKILGRVIINDGTDLKDISDNAYDFAISSNNLEHIANPIKALSEMKRVVHTGGCILIIVPMKRTNFDHRRDYTDIKHLINDYLENIGENDLSHLQEVEQKHDYKLDPPCGGKESFHKRALDNYNNRCLHQHVFDVESLLTMMNFLNLEIINCGNLINDFFCLVSVK